MKKVKEIKSYRKALVLNSINAQDLEEQEYLMEEKCFDLNGKLLNEKAYSPEGELINENTFLYTEEGHLKQEDLYDQESDITEKKTYERNENGRIVNEFIHYIDNTYDTIKYNYDSNGNIISKVTIDADGEMDQKEEFSYDGKHLIKKAQFDYLNNLIDEITYKYDDNGNQIETLHFDPVDRINTKSINEFNEQNQRIFAYTYNQKDQLIEKFQFFEDGKNRVVKIIEESQYGLTITELTYDEKDNIVKQVESNANNEINNKIERAYNENNDLIKSEVLIDRHGEGMNQNYIIEHQITYYED